MQNLSLTKKVLMITAGLLVVFFLCTAGQIFEFVDSNEIVVIQSLSGELTVHKSAGPVIQGYGKVTRYLKRDQFWFSRHSDEGDTTDQSIKIRFNDGGHATLSGSISFYMPMNDSAIIRIHTDFGSQEAIKFQLIKQLVTKSVYMTGPLMSSKESSAEKRTDLISYIDDQAMTGVYKTRQEVIKNKDELTGVEKSVTVVKIVTDSAGQYVRQEVSPAKAYDINLRNLTINSIDYDKAVETQIRDQQNTTMMIQQAIANSKKAEQDAITSELQGKASAAKAKWDKEVEKAAAVTEAEKARAVAEKDAQTAEFVAKKIRTEADAQAYANAKLVQAGLSPKEKAEYAMKTKIGVAAELAKIKLPDTYMSGGNTGKGGESFLESILGVKLLNLDSDKQ